MTRDEVFPSKWVKASDLPKPREVKIVEADMVVLKDQGGTDQEKLGLSFEGWSKRLILNVTNFDAIAEGYGDDTDAWVGKKIELFSSTTRMGNKVVACVRVRTKQPPGKTAKEAVNDEIPY
jgi:hypothetical protein